MTFNRQSAIGNRQCSNWRCLAVCLLLLVACSTPAMARWTRQPSGTMAWLHAVFFLDQHRGWAVGSKGTLLTTIDGGRNWQQKVRPGEDNLTDVYFSDEQNGWLVCEKNVYDLTPPRTYLLSTKDGGANWTKVIVGGSDADSRLVRAVFTQGGRGWVFGEAGTLYVTRDAGQSWKRVQLPTRYLLLGGAFIDENRGWLVGAGATIVRTSDGGESWQATRLVEADGIRFTATSFIDDRLGWAVGAGGKVFRTINGGRSWSPQNSGVATDLLDVRFLSALDGWAVGAEGTVLHTFDGGLHWVNEISGTTHPLERIFFSDRYHGWAVGFGGAILAYDATTRPRSTN